MAEPEAEAVPRSEADALELTVIPERGPAGILQKALIVQVIVRLHCAVAHLNKKGYFQALRVETVGYRFGGIGCEGCQEPVAVSPGKRGKTILCGSRNTIRTLIRIKTPASSTSRPPVQVACVLDRISAKFGQKWQLVAHSSTM